MKKRKKSWVLAGGGTLLAAVVKYPCDANYYNKRLKKYFSVSCTSEAYHKMPDSVRSPSEVLRRRGVDPHSLSIYSEADTQTML